MSDNTKLIAELRITEKAWREQVGDMSLFGRAADALEAAEQENEQLADAGIQMQYRAEAAEKRIAELEAENERAEDEIREWKRHR